MKKFLFFLLLTAAVGYGIYHTFSSRSYELSRQAQDLYDKGEYREAFKLADKALNMNRLNRQAIALRPKLRRIVEGEDMLIEATKLYEEAVNNSLEGRVEDAKIKMSQAFTIADKISGLSPSKPGAKELMKQIERDTALILDRAPEAQYTAAIKFITDGKLTRAYEVLNNIQLDSEKVRRKKSEVAYELGLQRYREAAGQERPSAVIVQDGIYWFSKVDHIDDNYTDATIKMSELQTMDTK